MLDLAQMTGYGAAGLKAYERYQQAATDDSAAGVHRQAAAMGRFDGQLAAELWSSAVGLDVWADKLAEDPKWAGSAVTQEQVDLLAPIFARVRQDGLDAGERQGFADAGMSTEAIARAHGRTGRQRPRGRRRRRSRRGVAAHARRRAARPGPRLRRHRERGRGRRAEHRHTARRELRQRDTGVAAPAPAPGHVPRHIGDILDDEPLTVTSDFGDGGPSAEGAQVTHTFNAGTFEVTQTVFDGVSTSSATRTIVATPPNGAPTARIVRTPAQGEAPLSVSFDGSDLERRRRDHGLRVGVRRRCDRTGSDRDARVRDARHVHGDPDGDRRRRQDGRRGRDRGGPRALARPASRGRRRPAHDPPGHRAHRSTCSPTTATPRAAR